MAEVKYAERGRLTMAMVCPQCHNSFDQRLQCPNCGVRLVYQASALRGPAADGPDVAPQWQHTPWGRICIGLLLAQGLYYGLRNLFQAALLAAFGGAGESAHEQGVGFFVAQGLLAVGLLVGGGLAGAGQRHGYLLGGFIGLLNGILYLAAHQANLLPMAQGFFTPVTIYALPLMQTGFGAVGGIIGSSIWRPPARVETPLTQRQVNKGPVVTAVKKPSPFTGPIHWVRVLCGIAVATAGTVWAEYLMTSLLDAAGSTFKIDDRTQEYLVRFEITALAILLGGAIAGATTANGLKQGLCVGLGAMTVLLGIRMSGPKVNADEVILIAASAVVLALVGGWFGGQLLPPLVYRQRIKALE